MWLLASMSRFWMLSAFTPLRWCMYDTGRSRGEVIQPVRAKKLWIPVTRTVKQWLQLLCCPATQTGWIPYICEVLIERQIVSSTLERLTLFLNLAHCSFCMLQNLTHGWRLPEIISLKPFKQFATVARENSTSAKVHLTNDRCLLASNSSRGKLARK